MTVAERWGEEEGFSLFFFRREKNKKKKQKIKKIQAVVVSYLATAEVAGVRAS